MSTTASSPLVQPSGSTGAHLSITVEELFQLRLVALGQQPPTLIIRGGQVLALHTGELLPRDVAIHGRHIAAITPWDYFPKAVEEIDARGKFISPGFIDSHIHVEYTKLVPGELAR
jgi:adenine deaminase